jgi:N-acetylmuramoyl-L-alanine amidase
VEKEVVGDTELKLEDVLKDKNFTVMTRLEKRYIIINER